MGGGEEEEDIIRRCVQKENEIALARRVFREIIMERITCDNK